VAGHPHNTGQPPIPLSIFRRRKRVVPGRESLLGWAVSPGTSQGACRSYPDAAPMKGPHEHLISRRRLIAAAGVGGIALLLRPSRIFAGAPDGDPAVDPQPYFAGVNRAVGALAGLGAPLAPADAERIAALSLRGDRAAVGEAEGILGRYTLASLALRPDGSVDLVPGGAERTLVEQGWRMFLVRVENLAGSTDGFEVIQGGFRTPGRMQEGNSVAQRSTLMDTLNKGPLIEKMWLMTQLHGTTPIVRYGIEIPVIALSGIPLEYHVVQLFSQDRGPRTAALVASTFPMASGADACLIGRAWAWALGARGEAGVSHVISVMRSEMLVALALTGCTDVKAVGRELLAD